MASKLIGIVGATGTGKSTSIKHLDPKSTYIINTAKKELPFKGAEKLYNSENKNYKEVDEIVEITRLIKTISEKAPHIKNIVIEDSNYMMAFRMAGNSGAEYKDGEPTRLLLSLKAWGATSFGQSAIFTVGWRHNIVK